MKKKIVWLLAVALLLCGCSASTRSRDERSKDRREEQRKEQREGLRIVYEICDEAFTEEEVEDCLYKLRKRVDASGNTEAKVYRTQGNRINVDIPGEDELKPVLESLSKRGEIYFVLGTDNVKWIYGEGEDSELQYELLKPLEEIEAAGDVILDGSDIRSAEAGYYNEYGMVHHVVTLKFNDSGRAKFAEATGKHIGETIAIIYDGEIISVPMVQLPLTEGVAQISGDFSAEEAESIAASLRVGALPLELREISCKVVKMK